jgi:Zn-dependent peptidase ImmA (M78 family)
MAENTYADELELVNRFREDAPVDVEHLAFALGLKVSGTILPPEMSGWLAYDKESDRYSITYNLENPKTRQRFTIAHELGHYMLHRRLVGDGVNDSKAYRTSEEGRYYNARIGPQQETEANRFAANVLMPTTIIRQLQESGLTDPKALAARLEVSQAALNIRLSDLDKFRRMESKMMNHEE